MRIMALDVGERRIGIALSDPEGITAQPFATIERDGDPTGYIVELARNAGVSTIVIGLPLLMDGREGSQASKTRAFAEQLRKALSGEGMRLEFLDERLTSKEAENVIREISGKVRERRASDMLAAALILRVYLDMKSGEGAGQKGGASPP